MRYVPFGPDLDSLPNVIVDGAGNDASVLALSHWPGNSTPDDLKADSSAEIVLNYLRSENTEALRGDAEAVSNNHFDVDGLMGLWAILHADEALEKAELIVAIAECGDFERWTGEHAAKAVCAVLGLQTMAESPLAEKLGGQLDHHQRTAVLYEGMLELVPQLLSDIDSLERYWHDEYESIVEGRKLFESREASVKELPEVDLAVFTLPKQVHTIAINEQTQCSRVALIVNDDRYLVRYRYESWVDYRSRSISTRVDLRPFAELLQTFEGYPGYWEADDVASIVPALFFRNEEDAMAPSSVTSGLFVKLLAQFMGDNADNEALVWSPATADLAE